MSSEKHPSLESPLQTTEPVPSSNNSDVEKSAAPVEQTPDRLITGWRWFLLCLGIYLASFLYGLDNTIAADAQGPILSSLGDIQNIGWVGIGFPLGSVATILPIGAAYGTFNLKWIYIGSIILFEIGSAICGSAPVMNALIVGRVIAGIGGSGIYLGGLSYMSIFTTPKERTSYVGGIGTAWAVGTILGPVISGAFSDSSATWRWAFYINLVIAAVTAPIYLLLVPSLQPQPDPSVLAKLKNMDWTGTTLLAAAYVLFVTTASLDGSTWAWNSGASIAMWVVFGVVLIACIAQQYFSIFTSSERRTFPCTFLKSRALVLFYIATAGTAAAFFLTIYYIPLYFQFVRGDTAIRASVRLLPSIFLFVLGVTISGAMHPAIGFYSPWYILGGACSLAGSVLMYTVDRSTSAGAIYGYTILIAFGTGLNAQMAYSLAAAKVDPAKVPAAISYINSAQIGGFAITLAIATSIFQNVGYANLASVLGPKGFSPDAIRAALAGTENAAVNADPDLKEAVLDMVVKTISLEYTLAIAGSCMVLLAGLAMKWEKVAIQ